MERLTQILLITMIIAFIMTCIYVTYFFGYFNGVSAGLELIKLEVELS